MKQPPPIFARVRRESDSSGWSRYERLVLGGLERVEEKVDDIGNRVAALEAHRASTMGADAIRSRVWTWVLGIVAVVIAGLIMLAVRGLGR